MNDVLPLGEVGCGGVDAQVLEGQGIDALLRKVQRDFIDAGNVAGSDDGGRAWLLAITAGGVFAWAVSELHRVSGWHREFANLTASRISPNAKRRLRIWAAEGYAGIDFMQGRLSLVQPSDELRRHGLNVNHLDPARHDSSFALRLAQQVENDFVEVLPRTATGKLQKFKLRERFWQGMDRQVN